MANFANRKFSFTSQTLGTKKLTSGFPAVVLAKETASTEDICWSDLPTSLVIDKDRTASYACCRRRRCRAIKGVSKRAFPGRRAAAQDNRDRPSDATVRSKNDADLNGKLKRMMEDYFASRVAIARAFSSSCDGDPARADGNDDGGRGMGQRERWPVNRLLLLPRSRRSLGTQPLGISLSLKCSPTQHFIFILPTSGSPNSCIIDSS